MHPAPLSICIITIVCLRIVAFHTQAAQLAGLTIPMSYTDLIEGRKTENKQAPGRTG